MDALQQTAAEWGLSLGEHQLAQFAAYADELAAWNARVNLTAILEPHEIVRRHFLDALSIARYWRESPTSLIDIGSGAGFPGLPLKILLPDLRLTLVESIGKKTSFLTHIAIVLGLEQVQVVTACAEEVGQDAHHREQYDIATARAVADLRVLAEYCLPLCRVGGQMIAPKGEDAPREAQQAERAIELLGGRLTRIEPVTITGLDTRQLVIVDKLSPTPPGYPRRVGIAAKRPL